jgi:hypothetical protein
MNLCTYRKRLAAITLLVVLAAGCSYTVVPRTAPVVREAETQSLTGIQVLVVNEEKDASVSPILGSDQESSYFKANRRAWAQKLVETLARELSRRGASVRSGAPLTLGISVSKIMFIETRLVYQLNVKASVTSSGGWSKEYTGIAEVNASSVFSIENEANQLAGQALANLVSEILGDAEFLRQLIPA